ncbi:hemolysin secretion protein D [Salinivibrio kushneri]|uniref:Membrane fusion protein (MFP) family protein n=1 Tax=Salinivibrio kushneri TaxID=1908198 RepID=A0AB36K6P5_9GAMM|nr:HlyD family type I secretion periplasmic adaptor subunit [Salinivibrio kushneri]OOE43371.1 hemolysin secretion protein D [Salinivibrio kushneri]OOE46819.1 hemolysin secretion protein D [Salinivibrio kushneri]
MKKVVKKGGQQTDLDMIDDVYGAMMINAPLSKRATVWAIFLLVTSFIIWSAIVELDQVTRGNGKVVPPSKIQTIQSLDGGRLSAMHVKEGQQIEKGMILAQIDRTRAKSELAQIEQNVGNLRALIARHKAEIDSINVNADSENWRKQIEVNLRPIGFTRSLRENNAQLVARHRDDYINRVASLRNRLHIKEKVITREQQRITRLKSKVSTLTESISLIQREINITRPLVEKKSISEVELIALKKQMNKTKGELSSVKTSILEAKSSIEELVLKRQEVALQFISETREKIRKAQDKVSRLINSVSVERDKVEKTTLRAPVSGTIKEIKNNTIGSVIQPGKTVLEIVPSEEKLVIEAKVKPKDIGFLYPGLPAVVKITAYDFTRYGGLEGKVEHISADTTQDDEGNSFYLLRVSTESAHLTKDDGTRMPIIPGMLASVDIMTGKRTVLEYILNPILRAKENALRE